MLRPMKSKLSFTKDEAAEIVRLIEEKLKADTAKQKVMRDKIRKLGFHASDYGFRSGYTVKQFLSVAKIMGVRQSGLQTSSNKTVISSSKQSSPKVKSRCQSDESYVIDLCDEALKLKALRQHPFDFLKGDSGRKLPVDAFYPPLNLVIEFKEKQHSEEMTFFDRRETVSGFGRGEQRKLYDWRFRTT